MMFSHKLIEVSDEFIAEQKWYENIQNMKKFFVWLTDNKPIVEIFGTPIVGGVIFFILYEEDADE